MHVTVLRASTGVRRSYGGIFRSARKIMHAIHSYVGCYSKVSDVVEMNGCKC